MILKRDLHINTYRCHDGGCCISCDFVLRWYAWLSPLSEIGLSLELSHGRGSGTCDAWLAQRWRGVLVQCLVAVRFDMWAYTSYHMSALSMIGQCCVRRWSRSWLWAERRMWNLGSTLAWIAHHKSRWVAASSWSETFSQVTRLAARWLS